MASNENIVIEDTVGNIEDVVAMETQEILETKGFLESQEILVPTQCRVNCLKLFVTSIGDSFEYIWYMLQEAPIFSLK